ncbi:PAS domain-containing sensor histidine kinase [Clostridium sp. Ade.TY]|uniref:sensor histidine kinase n=1 Tax=Clostridium sp. Ade.TY TaxID=1391647 RepID=UPI00040387CF|nr:PAS domain-containing sensor histidine kinase [Clostridium sp. Ade.TY]
MGSVWKRILDSISVNYFYCKILRDKEDVGNDLLIEETNFNDRTVVNKKFSELLSVGQTVKWVSNMNFLTSAISICNEYGEFNTDNVSLKRVDDNYVVLWCNSDDKSKSSIFEDDFINQKKLLELFIDAMPDYVFYKDINGNYLICNRKFSEHLGMSKNEIIGKTDYELFSEDTARSFRQHDIEVIRDKRQKIYVEEKVLNNNKKFIEETVKVPYFDMNNNILGVIGVSKDISYKVAVEESILNNELILFNMLNNLEDAIIIKDSDKVVFVNQAFEKIFGISRGELYKKDSIEITREMLHDDDKKLLDKIDYNEPLDVVARLIRRDNEMRWVWIRSNPLKDENKNTIRRIIVINDITNQKQEEKELDKLRREFFANISHEFKTPINLIYTSIQLLDCKLDRMSLEDKEKFDMYISTCNKNIFRMIKLINNMIDSIKISEGVFKHRPKKIEIVSLVEDIVIKANKFLENSHINIVFDTEFEEKLALFDKDHLERIILNILSNAIKFNDKNEPINVDLLLNDGMIEIRIRDRGIGISIDKLNSLFSRLKNVNNRMTKVNEGCGIGLYIAKELVELHGGEIKIKSVLGAGTEVLIRIPDVLNDLENLSSYIEEQEYIEHIQLNKIEIEFSDIYLN